MPDQKTNYLPKFCFSQIILFFSAFLFTTISLQGQINTPKYKVDVTSNDMGPCGGANDGTTTAVIKSKLNAANTFRISFDLPNGITYKAGSVLITNMSGSQDFTISELDVSDLSTPVFGLERNSNANWQINDEVTFIFGKTADCDAVQFSYNSGVFKDKHAINFIDDQGNHSNSDTDETVNAYDFLRPYLAISDSYDNIVAIKGEPTSRTVPVENSGNGSLTKFTHIVSIGNNIINYDLYYNNTLLSYTTNGSVREYDIDLSNAPFSGAVGDGDILFENETIALEERFILNNCENGIVSHATRWGCSVSVCQNSNTSYGEVHSKQNNSELEINEVSSPTYDFGQTSTFVNSISNTSSTDIAYNVHINIGLGTESWVKSELGMNPLWGSDYNNNRIFSNFRLNGNSVTPTRRPFDQYTPTRGAGSYYFPEDYFSSDPDGAGGFDDLDGDGFYDDLPPNATSEISFDIDMMLSSTICDEDSDGFLSYEQVHVDAFTNIDCALNQETERRYISDSSMYSNWVTVEPPADTNNNEVFNIKIESSFAFYGNDILNCNGNNLLTDDPGTTYEINMTVPNGVNLSGSPTGFSQTGNVITYKTSELSYNYVRILEYFPLVLDCSVYAGGQTVSVDYDIKYKNDCFTIDLFCGSTSFNTHCEQFIAGCSGPTTASFTAERETAGWTDSSMSSNVTLSSPEHETRRYLAKDEMKITTSAKMRNYHSDNLYLDINYDTSTDNTVNADIIEFVSGTITIKDLSSGSQSTTINVPPTLTTNGNDDHLLTFDLSSYRSIISGTYEYGEGLEEDEISLELHFVFKEDFEENKLFELENFTAEFYSLESGVNRISCDLYRESAQFYKVKNYIDDNKDFYLTACKENYLGTTLIQNSPLEGDIFKNEFRSSTRWISTEFIVPDGVEFLGYAIATGYPDIELIYEYPSSTNGGLNYSVSGNTVTVTPGPLFRENQIKSWVAGTIKIMVQTTENSLSSHTYTSTINYKEFAYSSAPVLREETTTGTIVPYIPEIQITPKKLNVDGNSVVESFEVEICNQNSKVNHDFSWLKVNAQGFNITNAYLVDSGTETPLNISTIGDDAFIEFGYMKAWEGTCRNIRFEGTYTNCNPQDLTLDVGWSCSGYPSDYASYNNYLTASTKTISFNPRPAAIQFSLLDQPSSTVDMCSDYTIELEYRNAGEGNLISPVFTFDVPGNVNGLDILDIAVEYPRNSGNIASITPTINGNIVTVNLSNHPEITQIDGIKGSFDATNIDEQIVIVKMLLNPKCDYISNTGSTYEAKGNSPCGKPAIGDSSRITTNPLIITGAEPPYVANNAVVSNLGNINGCTSETISIETLIVDGSTGAVDYVTITLPEGLEYVANSFNSTSTLQATFNSVITQNNQQIVEVALPNGAPSGSKIEYQFDILSTYEACSGTEIIELNSYVTTNNLFCNGVSCGTTKIVTGYNTADVTIVKPIIGSIGTATATYIQAVPGSNFYEIDYELENSGTVDLASGAVYNVYCADLSGNKIGSPIATGSVSQPIPAGNSINDKITFNSPSLCSDNVLVEFLPSTTNCFCDAVNILIHTSPSTDYADLELSLTSNNSMPNIGDVIIFSITVENKGLLAANNIEIENVVPEGYTVVTIDNGGFQAGNTINWSSFSLANGSTATYTYTTTFNTPTGAVDEHLMMAQIIASSEVDPDSTPNNFNGVATLEDDEAVLNTTVAKADLSITKSTSAASPTDPNVGDTLSFEVTVHNDGAENATGIEIVDTVPSGYTLDASSITNGGTINGNTITWDIATLNSGNNLLLTYDVVVNAPTGASGEYLNIVQVTSVDQFDPDSTPNNFDDINSLEDDEAFHNLTTVKSSDLDLSKALSATSNSSPNVGETITFELTLNNNGISDATNIQIQDIVPAGYTLDASSISNGGSVTGNIISWDITSLLANSSLVLTYNVSVNASTGTTNEYQNIAQVTAVDQFDPDSTPNNFDDVATLEDDEAVYTLGGTPSNNADLEIDLAISDSNPNTNDTVTFTLSVLNNGPVDATNILIENYIPTGYTVIGIDQGGSQSGNTISWPLFNLMNGSSTTFSFTATINSPSNTSDEYQNVAQVVGVDQPDPDSTPNNFDGIATLEDDEAVIEINSPALDIDITKTADKTDSFIGDSVVFTVSVTNLGTFAATNISIDEALPNGFAYVSSIASNGTYNETLGEWAIASLASNETATLNITVTVVDGTDYTNVALLSFLDQVDTDSSNDSDSVTINVTQSKCLTVYNEFSPNGDGANEVFYIECIDQYPNNNVQIFNRWGNKVYEKDGYNNTWDGTSMGKNTINKNQKVPIGTYYYILDCRDGKTPQKTGWLYVTR